jgi:probable rRNA maturation factor
MDDRPSTDPASAGFDTDVEIIVASPAWRRHLRNPERVARRAAALLGEPMVVVLSDDREVRRLNARHRGMDKPTNVLTFDPVGPEAPGELVLALGVVRREAAASGKRLSDHLAHLVLHGGLHLLGYDHDHVGDARRMEMEESQLMAQLHRPNPWRVGAGRIAKGTIA